jgi:hypothetical protein
MMLLDGFLVNDSMYELPSLPPSWAVGSERQILSNFVFFSAIKRAAACAHVLDPHVLGHYKRWSIRVLLRSLLKKLAYTFHVVQDENIVPEDFHVYEVACLHY